MIKAETVRFNNDQTVTTDVGEFYVCQRLSGYADNDGKWVVELLPELYWSAGGCLRRRRPGAFVGVFGSIAAAEAAIAGTTTPAVRDEMVV